MTHPVVSPLYRQIYERIRASIAEGRLQPGDRLPSARGYAQELGVARGTVDLAYAILAGEGYVETNGRAGTRVTNGIVPITLPGPSVPPVTANAPSAAQQH